MLLKKARWEAKYLIPMLLSTIQRYGEYKSMCYDALLCVVFALLLTHKINVLRFKQILHTTCGYTYINIARMRTNQQIK